MTETVVGALEGLAVAGLYILIMVAIVYLLFGGGK